MNRRLCVENVREDWVPPEERNQEWMKQNFGPDSAHSFIYFPKEQIQTPEGYTLYFMRLPEDVYLYRGYKHYKCAEINNPNDPNCKACKYDTWFSDYNTARMYGSEMHSYLDFSKDKGQGYLENKIPRYLWVYQTKRPLLLLNFLDKRNLDVIVDILIKKIEASRENNLENEMEFSGYGTNNNSTQSRKRSISNSTQIAKRLKLNNSVDIQTMKDYLGNLIEMTGYQLNKEVIDKIWTGKYNGYQRERYLTKKASKNPPDSNPAELALVSEEFGDQSSLFRDSLKYLDSKILTILKFCLPSINFDGYYSPKYQSAIHTNEKYCKDKIRYFFHRELALFGTQGRVRRVPDSILNGCMNPYGGRRIKSIKNHKQVKKYSKTHKRSR